MCIYIYVSYAYMIYIYIYAYSVIYAHVDTNTPPLDLFIPGASTWASADHSDQHHATVDDPATRFKRGEGVDYNGFKYTSWLYIVGKIYKSIYIYGFIPSMDLYLWISYIYCHGFT